MLKVSKKFKSLALAGLLSLCIIPVNGCSSNNSNEGYEPTEYAEGEHQIVSVEKSFDPFFGKNGTYGLEAPEGYKITDYDYDKTDYFGFDDYTYENVVPVEVLNPNNIGTPLEETEEVSEVYESGEHVIVDIKRGFNPFFGKGDQVFHLTAPEGYDVLDYDYDKTDSFEFVNITYVNNQQVKVNDINQFGEVVDKVESKEQGNTYDVGTDFMVVLNRSFNPLFGKDEMKEVPSIPGYVVVDYDYDKTDSFEFETIVYKNIVPVVVENENEIGVPVSPVEEDTHSDGIYDEGEHVLVDIDRNLNFLTGYSGTKEVTSPDGYEVLDYDYDKNDDFEFDTIVYSNDESVSVSDSNDFGKVLKK